MNHDDYIELFGLSADDLKGRVLENGSVLATTQESCNGFSHPITRCAPEKNGTLPFTDFTFDLALCPNYLFTGAENLEFNLQQILELARVAKEVRVFPLSNHQGQPSPLLGPVLLGLQQENYGVEVRDVTTTSRPTAHVMLRVWAQQCHVSG